MASTELAAAKKAFDIVYKAYRRDQGNWYVLTEDLKLPPISWDGEPLQDFADEFGRITAADQAMEIFKAFGWNGADLFPDKGLLTASAVHDYLYGRLEVIAKAWGWTVEEVRRLADDIFASLAYRGDKGFKAFFKRVIYGVLRLGGGIYHKLQALVLYILLASLLGGCTSLPPDLFQGAEVPSAQYEKTN